MSSSTPDDHAPPTDGAPPTDSIDPPGSTASTEGLRSEEDAEAQAAQEAAETQAALVDLANSTALLPQAPPPEGEDVPEGAIALPVIEQDGTRYIPVFTTEEALVAAGGDPGAAVRLPIAELAANWPEDDLWLTVNPTSEKGLALPAELVRALPVFSRADGQADQGGGEGGGPGPGEPNRPPAA
ncbi:SseB family protein [Streptomyces sp. NPDC048639]|uniref:SseB family protein n=1 Tax=Streptomyces sp. NPDC048639 TaxID=3365581 RepID=UPI00371DF79A